MIIELSSEFCDLPSLFNLSLTCKYCNRMAIDFAIEKIIDDPSEILQKCVLNNLTESFLFLIKDERIRINDSIIYFAFEKLDKYNINIRIIKALFGILEKDNDIEKFL